MQRRFYTVLISHAADGRVRKLAVPSYALYVILLSALVGGATILAGITSYGRMLLRVASLNRVEAEREELRLHNQSLRSAVTQSNRWLTSLESLANEVAVTYGLLRLRQTPFGDIEAVSTPPAPVYEFRDALARFEFLRRHATPITLYASGLRPLPGQSFSELTYTPSLWPVLGRLSSSFGERLDPFNGEGSIHAGVDISTDFGKAVRVAGDGFVVAVGPHTGYGQVVIVDHGFGITTWYAHLSQHRAYLGQAVRRGDIIGYVGDSGRSTGPHLHYEVRRNDKPVNPWFFLRA